MSFGRYGADVVLALLILVVLALIVRVLLRPHREPASRIAWIVVILAVPVFGIISYILFGEVNIGRRRVARIHEVLAQMPDISVAAPGDSANLVANIPEHYAHLFRVGSSDRKSVV